MPFRISKRTILGSILCVGLDAASIACGQTVPERVNLAKFQKATSSSHSQTYRAEYATDGIVNNFHSFRTGATGPHWLEIQWPRTVTLASAHLYLGLDNLFDSSRVLLNFQFQYHDGTAWVDVPGGAVSNNTQTEVNLIFSQAVNASRFRLWSGDSGSRVIREVAMFPPNPSGGVEQGYAIGTDLALSLSHLRPTEASSILSGGYFPKHAVDGLVNDASRWVSTNTAGQSIEVDLLSDHGIASAHVYTGLGETLPQSNFKLQSWNINTAAWDDIPGATITGNTSNALVIPFSSTVTTSRVRLLNTSASFTRVKELLLFPPREGGYPLGQDVKTNAPFTAKWDDYSDTSYRIRCGISDGRLLGVYDDAVRFSSGTRSRPELGWQLLLNHRDGSYRIRHEATGKCLATADIVSTSGTPVVIEDYSGMPHQDWFLQPVDATHFRIVNLYSGLALQTQGDLWTPGNPMVVRPVSSSDLQRWRSQDPIHFPKKGIAASGSNFTGTSQTWMENSWQLLNGSATSWSYSWGRPSRTAFPFMTPNHTYNPMQWGDFSWAHSTSSAASGPIDLLRGELQSSSGPTHVMGFNEPDREDQGMISESEAARRWPRLEALGTPLVAPVPANINGSWQQEFSAQADLRGLRRDYTAVHWYANPDATSLINFLQNTYNNTGRPIWLTEFSSVSWTGTGNWTRGSNFNFLAEFMWRAESLPWLKRYSLFQYREGSGSGTDNSNAPRSNTRNADGTLTAFGELYAGWDGITEVLEHKPYHLHNRAMYRRVRNPAPSTPADLITAADPDTPSSGTQWYLIPGNTTNTVRIVSRNDGRRIRYFTGTTVGMVAATNFTGQSEWRLVPDQHGWYFIEHPQSNTRLQMNSSGTLIHGLITGNTDPFRWRFVVPAVIENSAPVLASIPSQTVAAGSALHFTAAATDSDLPANPLTFSLIDAPSGATIDSATGIFTWTPTPAQTGNFNLTLRVSDGTLSHDQMVAITVNPAFPQAALDTDNDGISDLIELAFGTSTTTPNGNPFRLINFPPGTTAIQFPWNWSLSGLTWKIRHSQTLDTPPSTWPVLVPVSTSSVRDGNVDIMTVTPPINPSGRGFFVLEVSVD